VKPQKPEKKPGISWNSRKFPSRKETVRTFPDFPEIRNLSRKHPKIAEFHLVTPLQLETQTPEFPGFPGVPGTFQDSGFSETLGFRKTVLTFSGISSISVIFKR
jgi:hypothetical protein